MNVSPVLLTVDGHTPHSHLCAGSEHPDGNLSSVGHQDLLDGLDIVTCWTGGEVGEWSGQGGRSPSPSDQVLRHQGAEHPRLLDDDDDDDDDDPGCWATLK